MEAIANSPSLLYLLLMVITTAVLLAGSLVFMFVRRRKKSTMKHGINPAKNTNEEASAAEESKKSKEEAAFSPQPATGHSPLHNESDEEDEPAEQIDLDLGILGSLTPDNEDVPKETKPESSQTPAIPYPTHSPSTSAPVTAPAAPSPAERPEEVLRLLRDPESGQLIVEIAAQRYSKLADITDKQIGQHVLKLTAHLLAFTNGVIVTEAGMKSVYKPKLGAVPRPLVGTSAPAAEEPVDEPVSPTPVGPKQSQTSADDLPPIPRPSTEAEAPQFSLLNEPSSQQTTPPESGGLLSRVSQPPPPPPNLPGLNLAEEINDIVQARLRYSPLAEDNRVEITSDLSGGIRIHVNGQFYSSPDDISDPQIKKLIQDSIKEWERS